MIRSTGIILFIIGDGPYAPEGSTGVPDYIMKECTDASTSTPDKMHVGTYGTKMQGEYVK